MHIVQESLKDQVALVTGAGSGIGKAAALRLAQAGAKVGVLSRTAKEIEKTASAIRQAGGNAIALDADVSKAADVERAIATLQREWGRLDIVVANAGINGLWAPIEEISEAEWDKTLSVNLKGTYLSIKSAVPLLKRQGGSIVVVSSVNGTRMFSNAGASAYATSKAGQVAFAKMMALELAGWRVRVNTVLPGAIDTKIGESTRESNVEEIRPEMEFPKGEIPLTCGRSGSADQVADLIWFLCSPLASHITGAEVFIDGAESLLRG